MKIKENLQVVVYVPRLPATAVGTILIEIRRCLEQCRFRCMTFTAHWKAIVNMPICSQHGEEAGPQLPALLGRREGLSIANHDESVACARQKNIQTFRRKHEPNVSRRVAAGQRNQDNVALLSLIVVCYVVSIAAT